MYVCFGVYDLDSFVDGLYCMLLMFVIDLQVVQGKYVVGMDVFSLVYVECIVDQCDDFCVSIFCLFVEVFVDQCFGCLQVFVEGDVVGYGLNDFVVIVEVDQRGVVFFVFYFCLVLFG